MQTTEPERIGKSGAEHDEVEKTESPLVGASTDGEPTLNGDAPGSLLELAAFSLPGVTESLFDLRPFVTGEAPGVPCSLLKWRPFVTGVSQEDASDVSLDVCRVKLREAVESATALLRRRRLDN